MFNKFLTTYFSYRLVNLYSVLFIVAILGYTGYAQFHYGLTPCPLCIMQRLLFVLTGFLFACVAIYVPQDKGRKIFNGIILCVTLLGAAIAARHVYLQLFVDASTVTCGPGLNFIFKNLPLTDALHAALMGSGDCAEVHWQFLGLSMPTWSLLCFVFLSAINVLQIMRKKIFN